jgi:hypothetical protein
MDVSMKTSVVVLELLTVLSTDASISTGCDPRVSGRREGISGKRVQIVSDNFKGASKFVAYLKYYLKLCLYHVHVVRRMDLEIPRGLALNVTIINQCSRCFKTQQRPHRET